MHPRHLPLLLKHTIPTTYRDGVMLAVWIKGFPDKTSGRPFWANFLDIGSCLRFAVGQTARWKWGIGVFYQPLMFDVLPIIVPKTDVTVIRGLGP